MSRRLYGQELLGTKGLYFDCKVQQVIKGSVGPRFSPGEYNGYYYIVIL